MNFTDAAAYPIPFGKHQGRKLDDIATSDAGLRYLDWLRGEIESEGHRRRAYQQSTLDALRVYLDDPTIARDLARLNGSP